MKIVCLIDSLGSGGAQRQLTSLAISWKKLGHEVEFIVYYNSPFYEKSVSDCDITIHKIFHSNFISRIFKIKDCLDYISPDIVVAFMYTPSKIACIIKAISHSSWKLITSERGAYENNGIPRNYFLAWLLIRYSDKHICNSNKAMNYWVKVHPKIKSKIDVIYNLTNVKSKGIKYIPRSYGKLHIIIAASFQYIKNPLGVIEALHLIPHDILENIEINWYGHFSEVTLKAINFSKELNVDKYISFEEPVNNVTEKMEQSDVVMLVSKTEGLPNVICEGMMLGKPIIMSKVSDYSIFITEKNGILVDWNSPQTIANAIVNIYKCPDDELLNMGHVSKNIALHYFSPDKITNEWINLMIKLKK